MQNVLDNIGLNLHYHICAVVKFFGPHCITTGRSRLSSLALDSSRGILYFTDPGRGAIGVLPTDGGSQGSMHWLNVGVNKKPKAIAVDATNRCPTLIIS